MTYKRSPFPMHKGTASHTSALKQTYKEVWGGMTPEQKYDYTADQTATDEEAYSSFVAAAEKWWGTEAGQKKATTDPKFKHRVAETNVVNGGTSTTTSASAAASTDPVVSEVKPKTQFQIDKENIATYRATKEGNKQEMKDLKKRQKENRKKMKEEGVSRKDRRIQKKKDKLVRKELKIENKAEDKATLAQVYGRK